MSKRRSVEARLIESARQALAIARGEASPSRITTCELPGDAYYARELAASCVEEWVKRQAKVATSSHGRQQTR